MRESDLNEDRKDMPDTAIIRRMRNRRAIRIGTGDSILFDVAAYKLDRELGVAEHTAVENNLRIVTKWPDIIFDTSAF